MNHNYGLDLGLEGVHVLVTGASGGIGLETIRVFHSQGAKVTAHYYTNEKSLQPFIASNPRGQAAQADLSDEPSVVRLFENAQGTFGPVQILIVNHAVSAKKRVGLDEISLERWKTIIDTNLTGAFLVTKYFLKHLKLAEEKLRDDAAIIFIGSTDGKFGEIGNADYAATKSALMYGLTTTLKNEIVKIAPKGRVNCVAPGWVKTPMAEEALKDPDVVYSTLATTPLKKVAEPIDIANQIAFLSSNKVSGHVSGQVIMVEGGMEGHLLNTRDDVNLPG